MKRFSFLLPLFAALLTGCQPDGGTTEESIATDIENTTWELGSHEAGTAAFRITSSMKWMITKESGWVDFDPDEGEGDAGITMSFTANTAAGSRTVKFSVTGIGATDNTSLTYTLVQPGLAGPGEYYLLAEPRQVAGIPYAGVANQTITVTANVPWSAAATDGWITVGNGSGSDNGSFTYTIAANSGAVRTGAITLSCTDPSLDVPAVSINLEQNQPGDNYLWVGNQDITGIPYSGVSNLTVDVTANVPWSAAAADNWITVGGGSGTGNGPFTYTVAANGGTARTGTITLSCTDASLGVPAVTISLSQNKNDGATGEQPYGWLELPRVVEEGDNHFSVLFAPLPSNSRARNYSMLYDYNEKMAYWVAYPLHPVYFIGSGRSDSWTYNPDVPSQYQADGYQSGYSKGHQIPSSDRPPKGDLRNRQTFYYTNITPQIQNEFNGGIWLKLENAVKNWAKSSGSNGNDTLYVVTGAALRKVGGNETIKRESKNNVAIPNYYYKVLLKKKRNSSTEYTAIGFWFEHKNYDTKAVPTHNNSYTVDQIEEWTGFDFFANLPEDVQSGIESVKETSEWSIDTSSN